MSASLTPNNSKARASRRASRSWHARAALLIIGVSSVLGCSVYDETLRQSVGLGPVAGGADGTDGGSNSASAGASAAGADTSAGGAGTSAGGDQLDAGAPGASGESGELPTAGASHGGSAGGPSGGAGGGTGGALVSAGAAGMLASGGSGGAVAGGGAGAGAGAANGGSAGAGTAGAVSELGVGKATTASTQQPANASSSGNDGQTTTRWSATTAALPQWWRVDLGASHVLSQVSVQFEFADRKYTYAVETSADDTSYTAQANVVDGVGAVQVVPIPSNVSARYVRITCTNTVPGVDSTGASRPTWVSFWEVSVLGS